MADETTAAPAEPPAADPPDPGALLTAGMAVPMITLGPYVTLQEAVARLGHNPLGLLLDEAGAPITVVSREGLLALSGGGRDRDRAHGRMGARQAARERRGGTLTPSHTLISLREQLPPLVQAAVGSPLAGLAAGVRAGGAVGVLVLDAAGQRLGVLPARSLLRRTGEG